MSDRKTHIRTEMQEARRLLLDAAAHIDEETAVASTENPEWRVRDILSHVAASEAGMLRNIERFLAGGELPDGFDLGFWNRRQVEKRSEAGVGSLLVELEASRAQAWAALDRLSEDELDTPGTHPAGFHTTVAGMFYTIANHELDHGNEIRTALDLPIEKQADWQLALNPRSKNG